MGPCLCHSVTYLDHLLRARTLKARTKTLSRVLVLALRHSSRVARHQYNQGHGTTAKQTFSPQHQPFWPSWQRRKKRHRGRLPSRSWKRTTWQIASLILWNQRMLWNSDRSTRMSSRTSLFATSATRRKRSRSYKPKLKPAMLHLKMTAVCIHLLPIQETFHILGGTDTRHNAS